MKKLFAIAALAALGFAACGGDNSISSQIPDTTTPAPAQNPPSDPPAPNPPPAPKPDDPPAPSPSDVQKVCHGNNFQGQTFQVVDAGIRSITSDIRVVNCPASMNLKAEIRRHAPGILEFVGDVDTISGNQIAFNPRMLPKSCAPKKGETLKIIWKPRRHHKN